MTPGGLGAMCGVVVLARSIEELFFRRGGRPPRGAVDTPTLSLEFLSILVLIARVVFKTQAQTHRLIVCSTPQQDCTLDRQFDRSNCHPGCLFAVSWAQKSSETIAGQWQAFSGHPARPNSLNRHILSIRRSIEGHKVQGRARRPEEVLSNSGVPRRNSRGRNKMADPPVFPSPVPAPTNNGFDPEFMMYHFKVSARGPCESVGKRWTSARA